MDSLTFDTPIGAMRIISSKKGVSSIMLCLSKTDEALAKGTSMVAGDILGYLGGERPDLMRHSLDIRAGTQFQKAVWDAARRIPHGCTVTYSEIARMAARPGAARAAGRALAANPIPILIPCHRIVSAAGIGGFSYGLSVKRKLLFLESQDGIR